MPTVKLWSLVAVIVSAVSIVTVVIVEVTSWIAVGDPGIAQPWHSIFFVAPIAAGLGALTVNVGSRVIALIRKVDEEQQLILDGQQRLADGQQQVLEGQRRTAEMLAEVVAVLAAMAPADSPDDPDPKDAAGLTPEVIAAAHRLTARLTRVA